MTTNYDNSDLCGECTGAGCKHCYDRRGILTLGTVRFPLSLATNNAKPPMIAHSYSNIIWRHEARKLRLLTQ